jgi:eukaryotic-like serine/threonine-protein kinase
MSRGEKGGQPSEGTAPGRATVDTPRLVVRASGSDRASGLQDTAEVTSDTALATASSPVSESGAVGNRTTGSGKDPRHDDHQELIGTTLSGRYLITRKVGQGGMGAVYEATHTLIGKRVAVKVLLDKYAKREALVARLEQEARLASSIGHEHIVDINDFGVTEDGRNFVVMEFLDGESLAELLQREVRLPEQRVLQIGQQAASALSAAHAKGIVHRDIKPENVFLLQRKDRDFVKVVDFGISKSMPTSGEHGEELPRLTETGMVLGTPLYMSPEQARGDDDLNERVDVYALGVIMYEASTGRVPFQGSNYLSVISQVLGDEPTSPRQIVPALSEEFEALVLRAMAKDRNDRYPSCEALLRDLNVLLEDPSHSTERARITGPRKRPPPRSGTKVAIWVAVSFATLAALILFVSFMMNSSERAVPVVPVAAALDARVFDASRVPDALAPSRTVEYQVESEPSGAQIWDGGRDLGKAPTSYRAVRGKDERIRLIAELPGYNDTEFFINPAVDPVERAIKVVLEQPKKGAPRRILSKPPGTGSTVTKDGKKPDSAGGGDLGGNPYRDDR